MVPPPVWVRGQRTAALRLADGEQTGGGMGLLFIVLMIHGLLATMVPSFWWVPDLTLVGLVLTIIQRPKQWLSLSGLAILCPFVWVIRFSLPVLMSYLMVGFVVSVIATQWDATDVRVQILVVGLASLVMTLGLLWLEGQWSVSLLGCALARVVLTSCSLLGVRSLFMLFVRPRSSPSSQ